MTSAAIMDTFDVVVIGAGPAGEAAAVYVWRASASSTSSCAMVELADWR
jgi:thioredoxin reductase